MKAKKFFTKALAFLMTAIIIMTSSGLESVLAATSGSSGGSAKPSTGRHNLISRAASNGIGLDGWLTCTKDTGAVVLGVQAVFEEKEPTTEQALIKGLPEGYLGSNEDGGSLYMFSCNDNESDKLILNKVNFNLFKCYAQLTGNNGAFLRKDENTEILGARYAQMLGTAYFAPEEDNPYRKNILEQTQGAEVYQREANSLFNITKDNAATTMIVVPKTFWGDERVTEDATYGFEAQIKASAALGSIHRTHNKKEKVTASKSWFDPSLSSLAADTRKAFPKGFLTEKTTATDKVEAQKVTRELRNELFGAAYPIMIGPGLEDGGGLATHYNKKSIVNKWGDGLATNTSCVIETAEDYSNAITTGDSNVTLVSKKCESFKNKSEALQELYKKNTFADIYNYLTNDKVGKELMPIDEARFLIDMQYGSLFADQKSVESTGYIYFEGGKATKTIDFARRQVTFALVDLMVKNGILGNNKTWLNNDGTSKLKDEELTHLVALAEMLEHIAFAKTMIADGADEGLDWANGFTIKVGVMKVYQTYNWKNGASLSSSAEEWADTFTNMSDSDAAVNDLIMSLSANRRAFISAPMSIMMNAYEVEPGDWATALADIEILMALANTGKNVHCYVQLKDGSKLDLCDKEILKAVAGLGGLAVETFEDVRIEAGMDLENAQTEYTATYGDLGIASAFNEDKKYTESLLFNMTDYNRALYIMNIISRTQTASHSQTSMNWLCTDIYNQYLGEGGFYWTYGPIKGKHGVIQANQKTEKMEYTSKNSKFKLELKDKMRSIAELSSLGETSSKFFDNDNMPALNFGQAVSSTTKYIEGWWKSAAAAKIESNSLKLTDSNISISKAASGNVLNKSLAKLANRETDAFNAGLGTAAFGIFARAESRGGYPNNYISNGGKWSGGKMDFRSIMGLSNNSILQGFRQNAADVFIYTNKNTIGYKQYRKNGNDPEKLALRMVNTNGLLRACWNGETDTPVTHVLMSGTVIIDMPQNIDIGIQSNTDDIHLISGFASASTASKVMSSKEPKAPFEVTHELDETEVATTPFVIGMTLSDDLIARIKDANEELAIKVQYSTGVPLSIGTWDAQTGVLDRDKLKSSTEYHMVYTTGHDKYYKNVISTVAEPFIDGATIPVKTKLITITPDMLVSSSHAVENYTKFDYIIDSYDNITALNINFGAKTTKNQVALNKDFSLAGIAQVFSREVAEKLEENNCVDEGEKLLRGEGEYEEITQELGLHRWTALDKTNDTNDTKETPSYTVIHGSGVYAGMDVTAEARLNTKNKIKVQQETTVVSKNESSDKHNRMTFKVNAKPSIHLSLDGELLYKKSGDHVKSNFDTSKTETINEVGALTAALKWDEDAASKASTPTTMDEWLGTLKEKGIKTVYVYLKEGDTSYRYDREADGSLSETDGAWGYSTIGQLGCDGKTNTHTYAYSMADFEKLISPDTDNNLKGDYQINSWADMEAHTASNPSDSAFHDSMGTVVEYQIDVALFGSTDTTDAGKKVTDKRLNNLLNKGKLTDIASMRAPTSVNDADFMVYGATESNEGKEEINHGIWLEAGASTPIPEGDEWAIARTNADILSYGTVKEGTFENTAISATQEYNVEAGVPSTSKLYFATGGSEFIVEMSLCEHTEQSYRTFSSVWKSVDCKFKEGDTAQAGGGTTTSVNKNGRSHDYNNMTAEKLTDTFALAVPEGPSSAVYTVPAHGGVTITAQWTGTIANNTGDPGVEKIHKNHFSGDQICGGHAGSMIKTGQEKAQGSYSWGVDTYNTALQQAVDWAKKLEQASQGAGNIITHSASDTGTRSWHIGDAVIDIKISGVNNVSANEQDVTAHKGTWSNGQTTTSGYTDWKLKSNDNRLSSGYFENHGNATIGYGGCLGYTINEANHTGACQLVTHSWKKTFDKHDVKTQTEQYKSSASVSFNHGDHSCSASVKYTNATYTYHIMECGHSTRIAPTQATASYSCCSWTYTPPATEGGTGSWSQTASHNSSTTPGKDNGEDGHVCTCPSIQSFTETKTVKAPTLDYTITVTFKNTYLEGTVGEYGGTASKVSCSGGNYPKHSLCGPCCEHVLPNETDKWVQYINYRSVNIDDIRVNKIYRSYVQGLNNITFNYEEQTSLKSNILNGDPNIWYNIGNMNTVYADVLLYGMKQSSVAAGRLRFSVQAQQLNDVVWVEQNTEYKGSGKKDARPQDCDGTVSTNSKGSNPVNVGGTGHNEKYALGCLYSRDKVLDTNYADSSSASYTFGDTTVSLTKYTDNATKKEIYTDDEEWQETCIEANGSTIKSKTSKNTLDEKDLDTLEYKRWKARRETNQTTYVLSDALILQTSTGDKKFIYGDAQRTTQTQQHIKLSESGKAQLKVEFNDVLKSQHIDGPQYIGPDDTDYYLLNQLLGGYNGNGSLTINPMFTGSSTSTIATKLDSGLNAAYSIDCEHSDKDATVKGPSLTFKAAKAPVVDKDTVESYRAGANLLQGRMNRVSNLKIGLKDIQINPIRENELYKSDIAIQTWLPILVWKLPDEQVANAYRSTLGVAGTRSKTLTVAYPAKTDSVLGKAVYSREAYYYGKEKINNIVIHTPISIGKQLMINTTAHASLNSEGIERPDQRTDLNLARLEESTGCPGIAELCENRYLDCSYFRDTVVFNTNANETMSRIVNGAVAQVPQTYFSSNCWTITNLINNKKAVLPLNWSIVNNKIQMIDGTLSINMANLGLVYSEDLRFTIRLVAPYVSSGTVYIQIGDTQLQLTKNSATLISGEDINSISIGTNNAAYADLTVDCGNRSNITVNVGGTTYSLGGASAKISKAALGEYIKLGAVDDTSAGTITGFSITRMAGATTHTDACYEDITTHIKTDNYACEVPYTFTATGGRQSFTAPVSGYYNIATYGASGGGALASNTWELGDYNEAKVFLTKGQTIYVYVGKQGTKANSSLDLTGGYNGGGSAGKGGYGGGGMTHVSYSNTDVLALKNSITTDTTSVTPLAKEVKIGSIYADTNPTGSYKLKPGIYEIAYSVEGKYDAGGYLEIYKEDTYTFKYGSSNFTVSNGTDTITLANDAVGTVISKKSMQYSQTYYMANTAETVTGLAIYFEVDASSIGSVVDFTYNVTAPPKTKEFTTPGAHTVTLDAGTYKLEAWGASGNTSSQNQAGGKGGYSAGTLVLNKTTTLYIGVGGQGTMSGAGWNGGGAGSLSYGGYGGGATHIATAKGSTSGSTKTPGTIYEGSFSASTPYCWYMGNSSCGAYGGYAYTSGNQPTYCHTGYWTRVPQYDYGATPDTLATYKNNTSDLLLVAGGGGGGSHTAAGGAGGSATAGPGAGGANLSNGSFGQGGSGSGHGGSGGGGYQGGNSGNSCGNSGAGGTGYANTSKLTNIVGTAGAQSGNGKVVISSYTAGFTPAKHNLHKHTSACYSLGGTEYFFQGNNDYPSGSGYGSALALNAGSNTVNFDKPMDASTGEYTVSLGAYASCLTCTCNFGQLYVTINGTSMTINQAVSAGYIKDATATSPSNGQYYGYSNVNNMLNGGIAESGYWSAVYVNFKLIKGSMTGLRIYASTYTNRGDGLRFSARQNKLTCGKTESSSGGGLTDVEVGKAIDFNYTGGIQTKQLPAGIYTLETWGAQGAACSASGGYGGYSKGNLVLDSDTTLYICVGQAGVGTNSQTAYNGGGGGRCCGGGGGGATHIATASGTLASLSSNRNSILLVAGGGGGGSSETEYGQGGAGGSATTNPGGAYNNGTASQTAGYAFGQGETDTYDCAGGGGGYYGGYRGNGLSGGWGGGGSGYANTSLLTSISGTSGARSGNGLARITPVEVHSDMSLDSYITSVIATVEVEVIEGEYSFDPSKLIVAAAGGAGHTTSSQNTSLDGTQTAGFKPGQGESSSRDNHAGAGGGWYGGKVTKDTSSNYAGKGSSAVKNHATQIDYINGLNIGDGYCMITLAEHTHTDDCPTGSSQYNKHTHTSACLNSSTTVYNMLVAKSLLAEALGMEDTDSRLSSIKSVSDVVGYPDAIASMPEKLSNGTYNPLLKCGGVYDRHECTSNCITAKVLSCKEPHHYGEHYDVGSSVCYKPCNNDDLHNHNIATVNGVRAENDTYISMDDYFDVYWDNTGDFYDTRLQGQNRETLAMETAYRGQGYDNNMETTRWIRAKYITFKTLNVLFYNEWTGKWEQHNAGELIRLPVISDGIVGNGCDDEKRDWRNANQVPVTRYHFYALLANHEEHNAIFETTVLALNDSETTVDKNHVYGMAQDSCDTLSLERNNKTRTGTPLYASYEEAYTTRTYDIVGSIGNMLLTHVTDFRYSNFFKKTRDEWEIQPFVYKIDADVQTNYLNIGYSNGSMQDIRGRQAKQTTGWFNTWRTQTWAETATPHRNVVCSAIQTQIATEHKEALMGYKAYGEISTIGDYQVVQMQPRIYVLDTITNELMQADLWQHKLNKYSPYYISGLTESQTYALRADGTVGLVGTEFSDLYSEEYTEILAEVCLSAEKGARNVSDAEISEAKRIAKQYETSYMYDDSDPDHPNRMIEIAPTMISEAVEAIGVTNLLKLDARVRTFTGSSTTSKELGGESTATHIGGTTMNTENKLNEEQFTYEGRRWQFTLYVPEETVVVPYDSKYNGGKHINPNNRFADGTDPINDLLYKKEDVESGRYVVIVALETLASGSVWNLKYDGSVNDDVTIKGRHYSFPDTIPPIVIIYDLDIEDSDFMVRKSH